MNTAKGNFAKAIELYEQATKLLPEFAEAEYQKGNAYLSFGKQPMPKRHSDGPSRSAATGRWLSPLSGRFLNDAANMPSLKNFLQRHFRSTIRSFPAYSALVELKLKTHASADVSEAAFGKDTQL